jgi:hypothetical protein
MTETMEKDLVQAIGEILQDCLARGMKAPLIVCAISPNGSVLAMRCPGGEPDILAEHYEGGSFKLPMTVLILDQDNQTAQVVFELGKPPVWH